MKNATAGMLVLATFCLSSAAADAQPVRSATGYDGSWRLSFMTRSGNCDPSYEFNVSISRGIISHPNLVRFRGRVARNGAARASVAVQNKVASGTGRLSATSGRGTWSGHSGTARCAGYWVAQRN